MPDGERIAVPQQEHEGRRYNKTQGESGQAEICENPQSPRSETAKVILSSKGRQSFTTLSNWKPVTELVGLIVLVVYTCVATYQWKATSDANSIAIAALQANERPYLMPTGFTLKPNRDVLAEFKNDGRGPALDLTARMTYHLTNASGPMDYSLSETTDLSNAAIGPGGTGAGIVGDPALRTLAGKIEFKKVDSGIRQLYVYGQFDYIDIYGNAYSPRFCKVYDPKTKRFADCKIYTFTDEPGHSYQPK